MMLSNKKYSIAQLKLQGKLFKLLDNVDNKYCCDCYSKRPRWASYTLGIFLCVRCAEIHRSMGVHISRIKSVDHVFWTVQQVATMKKIGNSRGRAIYEAILADNFCRPQTNSLLVEFIRSKYEFKRFIAKENSPTLEIRKLKENPNDKIFICNTGVNLRTPLSKIDYTANPESDNVTNNNDNDDEFGEFVSAHQEFTPNCQTTGSGQTEISNSPVLSGVNTEAYKNTLMHSDFQSQEYAMNGNNHSVPGQINANNAVDVQWHQHNNNSGITGNHISQLVIPILKQSDNVTNNNDNDEFGDFVSAHQENLPKCQTTGSATEPSPVSPPTNSSSIGNDTVEISNSPVLSGVDTEAYENTLMHSDFQFQEYAMNGNNNSVPGQINTNNTVDVQWHQLNNNSGITGNHILQPVIPILQLMQFVYYIMTNLHLPAIPESAENENRNIQHQEDNHPDNDLQDSSFNESLENPDSDFIVPIPESQREMSQLFTMLFE